MMLDPVERESTWLRDEAFRIGELREAELEYQLLEERLDDFADWSPGSARIGCRPAGAGR